jgi:peroxiredoxin
VQVPGYLAKQAELKAKGVDEVLVYCVNDGAVMKGWAKDQGVEGSMITFLGDTRGEFSAAVGMLMNHPGPNHALGMGRCKRFVIIADKGDVKNVVVSEAPDDPAGDADAKGPITAKTLVDNILAFL